MAIPDLNRNADCTSIVCDPRLARISGELASVLRPSIRILPEPLLIEPPVGCTKLGGCPDLPSGTAWPVCHIEMPKPSEAFLKTRRYERRLPPDGIVELAFVGQINLRDVHPFDADSRLPSAGLLSFFYNPQVFASDTVRSGGGGMKDLLTGFTYDLYGFDNIGNWQVIYSGTDSTLERRELPATLHDRIRYEPHGVTFHTEQTVPSIETSFMTEPNSDSGLLNLTKDEWQIFRELRGRIRGSFDINQMLGFADQWATTTDEGSYWHARPKIFPSSPEKKMLSKDERIATARNIRLLLQVNPFDMSADLWGRNGSLYFFIRDSDLDKRDFTKVWGATE